MTKNEVYLVKFCWDKQIIFQCKHENWQYDKTCYIHFSKWKLMLLIHIILIRLCRYRPVVVVYGIKDTGHPYTS